MRRLGIRRIEAVAFLAVAIVAFGLGTLIVTVVTHREEAARLPTQFVVLNELEPDATKWAKNVPWEYDSFAQTKTNYGRTKYGGSEAFSRLDDDPRLRKLFEGYAFSVAYNEERGHAWTVEDVTTTERNPTAGTCLTCKSGQVPGMMREMGVAAFYAAPFRDLAAQVQEPISCIDCHDSQTMELHITRPALIEAFERQGRDVTQATRQEMRSLVCAQCHVEYYFQGDGKYLTFPWDEGMGIEQIERYYHEAGFKDWTHPADGADLIKVQHPEYELASTGVHARSGVACADCHMPYTSQGAMKVTDHWVRSPLADISRSCAVCHRQSEAELKARVEAIQDTTTELLGRTEDAIVAAIGAIGQAAKAPGVDAALLAEARGLHRRAQLRWDFVAAENSRGFHSPQESARVLAAAIDFARQAELVAVRAQQP